MVSLPETTRFGTGTPGPGLFFLPIFPCRRPLKVWELRESGMICQKGKGRERTIGLLSTTRPTVINSGFLLKTAQFPAFLIQSGNISHRFKKVEQEIYFMDGSITTAHVRRQLILARVTQPGNWKLEGAGGILGRGNDADICLDDKTISRHHCRFLATPHGWMIEDLAATNGTRLNGVPVLRAYLNSGDWLDVGETRFRVNVVEAPGCVLAEAMDALWPSQPVNRAPYRRAA